MSKEMVGGCCVCSDERGWTENPLVYCDGPNCNVAVHQACYGIVTVPKGPWYCRKCESPERSARVKCELCPSKDGALKKTDGSGWAHVVCALYIPEVRFGNVTTMEPIVLGLIPRERYDKTCYICQDNNKGAKATLGACMQCNKTGCKQQFHVTCAQGLGLLCEEAGNYSDNVKYCGYCHHHYSKLRKGGNVRAIPPYKPVGGGDHDSSPEKDNEGNRSSGRKKSYLAVKPTLGGQVKKENTNEDQYDMDALEGDVGESSTLKFGTTTSHSSEPGGESHTNKFTTSNFVETVVTQSEPVFGSDTKTTTSPDTSKTKKRKTSCAGVKDGEGSTMTITSTPVSTITSTSLPIKTFSVALTQVKTTAPTMTSKASPQTGLNKNAPASPSVPKGNFQVYGGGGTKITIAATRDDSKKKPEMGASGVVTGGADLDNGPNGASASNDGLETGKRSRSSSMEKGRKPKRTNKRPIPPAKEDVDNPPCSPGKNRKKAPVKDEKETRANHPSMTAPHMLGIQLNPASSMAQKLRDSLHDEVAAHSIYSHEPQSQNLVGPALPNKLRSATSISNDKITAANSLLSLGNLGNTSSDPHSIADLLEHQWEQGNQFLMEQGSHFDIATLLSALNQLRNDNAKLEENLSNLTARRDHLLMVNARLTATAQTLPPPPMPETAGATLTRIPRPENGIVEQAQHSYGSLIHGRAPPQASPTLRGGPMNYNQQRRPVLSSYQPYPSPQQQQQQNQVQMNANSNMGVRRDDLNQQI